MASGKIVGTVKGSSASKYDFWVNWSSTPNTKGNYSIVNASAYLQRNDGYSGSAYNLNIPASEKYIIVNGVKTQSTEKGIDTRNSAKVLIARKYNLKVKHNDDGKKSITISASFSKLVDNLTGGSLSKKITLDTINRKKADLKVSISNITQNGATAVLKTDDVIDGWSYSLDNGSTWRDWGNTNSTQVTITHTILKPNTTYSVKYRVRKKSNELVTTSGTFTIKTLPIYITEISAKDLEINIGSNVSNYYKILPENASIKKLNIVSSNNDVVSVKNNQLNALKKGTSKITLSATDGSGITKKINANSIQRVSGIFANPSIIAIPKGAVAELQYSILPNDASNKDVILSSSDETIVSVQEKTIFGVENGNATVTITTVDGNFQTSIYVSVSGEYVWHNYDEPIEILNAIDINNIKSNVITIRSMLLSKGYDIDPLQQINAFANSSLKDIFDILQNIEYNLDIISNVDVKSIYYIEPKTIGEHGSNKEDIWRWIQILNEMYDILTGTIGKWQYLLCSDGYPTIDGKRILVRGDIIG